MKTKSFRTMAQRYIRVKSDSRGFTLLESTIALGILFISVVSALSLFCYGLKTAATTKYTMKATNIARAKLEEIKSTPFEDITTTFPDGNVFLVESTPFPEGATWTVSYPDGTEANPLEIYLAVSWEENGRAKQVELTTLVASS